MKQQTVKKKIRGSSYVLILAVLVAVLSIILGHIKSTKAQALATAYQSETLSEQALKDYQMKIIAYNQQIASAKFATVAPFMTNAVESTINVLDPGDVIFTLQIPALKLELPVYCGTDPEVLLQGAGMLQNTSFPGFIGGHSVITAHRGTATEQMFHYINELKPGDVLSLTTKSGTMKYKMLSSKLVLPDHTYMLAPVPGKDLVTLFTCDPYLINTHRLLVIFEKADFGSDELPDSEPLPPGETPEVVDIIGDELPGTGPGGFPWRSLIFLVSGVFLLKTKKKQA